MFGSERRRVEGGGGLNHIYKITYIQWLERSWWICQSYIVLLQWLIVYGLRVLWFIKLVWGTWGCVSYYALWFWAFYRNSEFLILIMRLKRLPIGVSAMGPRRWQLSTDAPCHSRCGTLENPHCSLTMSSEHRSKFAVLHQQWLRLHMNEQFSSGTKTQNKQ